MPKNRCGNRQKLFEFSLNVYPIEELERKHESVRSRQQLLQPTWPPLSAVAPNIAATASSFTSFSLPNTNRTLNTYTPFLSSRSSPLPHLLLSRSSSSSPLSLRCQHTKLPPLHPLSYLFWRIWWLQVGGGGGNNGGSDDDGDNAANSHRKEAMIVLAESKRTFETLPKDLVAAIQAGRITGAVVSRFLELGKSGILRWLLQFGGFKEWLLADDLFLAKVGMECGVGIFTKVIAIIADFMLFYLPAPTVSLRPPLASSAVSIAKFFYSCPDNAFQVALAGTSYSFLQRIGAIVVGTVETNALINARKAVDKC